VQFPLSNIRDAFEVELMASDDVFDQETRREVNIAIYHMLSEHMTSLAQMAEAVTSLEVPSEFKKFLISGAAKQEKIITRILEDFDQKDAEQLVLKLEETIDVEKAIQMSADNPEVQQMMQGGQQGPPQAPPGAEMVPSQELMG
jgi:predicted outer membrane protein